MELYCIYEYGGLIAIFFDEDNADFFYQSCIEYGANERNLELEVHVIKDNEWPTTLVS